MKTYNEKLSRFLNFVLYGLVILVIAGFIYLVIPKYQIQTVRLDNERIAITKLNTLTGKVSIRFESDKWRKFE